MNSIFHIMCVIFVFSVMLVFIQWLKHKSSPLEIYPGISIENMQYAYFIWVQRSWQLNNFFSIIQNLPSGGIIYHGTLSSGRIKSFYYSVARGLTWLIWHKSIQFCIPFLSLPCKYCVVASVLCRENCSTNI